MSADLIATSSGGPKRPSALALGAALGLGVMLGLGGRWLGEGRVMMLTDGVWRRLMPSSVGPAARSAAAARSLQAACSRPAELPAWLAEHPASWRRGRLLRLHARQALAPEAGSRALREAAARLPAGGRYALEMASARLAADGEPELALAAYQAAREAPATRAELRRCALEMGLLLLRLGRPRQARPLLEEARSAWGRAARAQATAGLALAALPAQPDRDLEALRPRLEALHALGWSRDLEAACQASLGVELDDRGLRLRLAALGRLGRTAQAVALLRARPAPTASSGAARVELELEGAGLLPPPEASERLAALGRRSGPLGARLALRLGDLAVRHGDSERALASYRHAAAVGRGAARRAALVSVGWCLLRAGEPAAARAALEPAVAAAPAAVSGPLRWALATALSRMGKADLARAQLEALRDELPEGDRHRRLALAKLAALGQRR